MSERIDYEAALAEHDIRAAFEGERGDCINLDDMKTIVDAALPDSDLYVKPCTEPALHHDHECSEMVKVERVQREATTQLARRRTQQ